MGEKSGGMDIYRRVGLIGLGPAGRLIAEAILMGRAGRCRLESVLVGERSEIDGMDEALTRQGVVVTVDPVVFFKREHDIVVEAAGPRELVKYAIQSLAGGADLVVMSAGALADVSFYRALRKKAEAVERNIIVAPGSLPGLDWISAASLAETGKLSITLSRPAAAWTGDVERELIGLKSRPEPFVFFEGAVSDAVNTLSSIPGEAVVLSLATLGAENVSVQCIADSPDRQASTMLEFQGGAGNLRIELTARHGGSVSDAERDAALGVIHALRKLTAAVKFGM